MTKLLDISEDTTAFPWANRTPWSGLQAVIAVMLALVIGRVTGHASAGAIAAGAAFTVGFAVFHAALASTLLSMAVTTVGMASATLAGSLGAPWTGVVLVLVVVAAVNYGLLAGLGPTEGWIGQQCGVFLVVASYFPRGPHYALGRAGMVLAGGGLQMVVFAIAFLVGRRGARRADPLPLRRVPGRLRELQLLLYKELKGGETSEYVARLALTLLVSTAIYRVFKVRNGYWIPMTALLVLKPQWGHTLSRGIARLVGTLLGAGIALGLARLLPFPTWVLMGLVAGSAWACYALQAVNYATFSVFITLYIVFLFRFGGFSETAAAHIRLANTAMGGGLALLIDAVWGAVRRRRIAEGMKQNVVASDSVQ
ncbi:MAG TPA: FUSC family protein [Acidobacteriaceae bacterium]|jgi:hypothetical protein|nr:FUSC family protein [Acidobacteriaceae bacterium]